MVDTRSVVAKWIAFALLGVGAAACDPAVTIADETSDAGDGGADAGSSSGGASSGTGGTSSGAASGGTPATGGNVGTGGVGTGGDGASGTSGGVSGTGGTGLMRLGLRLLMENPDPAETGARCPAASGIEWDIGAPILANGTVVEVASPTSTDKGTPLADGAEDAQIRCVVTAADGVINAEGGGKDPLLEPPNGRVNFTFNGTATVAERRNVAFFVYTPVTLAVGTAEDGFMCTLSELYEVLPGTFWGTIECPMLVDTGRPDVACKATATIVLQNCATE